MSLTFTLLLIFQAKHFLADYPLQGRYMLGKFRDHGFFWPLAAHVAVHGCMTFLIAGSLVPFAHALALAFGDALIHGTMDRIKASPRYLGRFKTLTADTAPTATPAQWRSSDRFWWSVGFDQMVHHLTHYAIIAWIVTHA